MSERIDQPREGFFETRLTKGGPWVGVRFWRDDSTAALRVEVNGRGTRALRNAEGEIVQIVLLDPLEVWPYCAGREISQREFEHRARLHAWAVEWSPDHPAAQPHQPIDRSKVPPRF